MSSGTVVQVTRAIGFSLCLNVCIGLALIAPPSVEAQSVFLDEAQTGGGADVRMGIDGTGIGSVGVCAGYSINSVVDLGVAVATRFAGSESGAETEFEGSLDWTVTLLKQTRRVPLSVALDGRFSAMVMRGESLRERELRERGTGYTIGMEVFQYRRAHPRLYVRAGALARFESAVFVTDRADGRTDEEYPRSRSREQLWYGGLVGLSWRPNRPDEGVAVSVDARVLVGPDWSLRVEPALNFTLVRHRPSEEWR